MKVAMFAVAVLMAASATTVAAEPPQAKISDLAWMAGGWTSRQHERDRRELWTTPEYGAIGGVANAASGGVSREFEFMTITQGAEQLELTIQGESGARMPTFFLKFIEPGQVVFETAEEPIGRVTYRRCEEHLCRIFQVERYGGSEGESNAWRFQRLP